MNKHPAFIIILIVSIFLLVQFSIGFWGDNSKYIPPEEEQLVYVYIEIPDKILPAERLIKYEEPIQELLHNFGYGEVTGAGTMMSALDEAGNRTIQYCGVDVDIQASKLDECVKYLGKTLISIGVPSGTKIRYTLNDESFEISVH